MSLEDYMWAAIVMEALILFFAMMQLFFTYDGWGVTQAQKRLAARIMVFAAVFGWIAAMLWPLTILTVAGLIIYRLLVAAEFVEEFDFENRLPSWMR